MRRSRSLYSRCSAFTACCSWPPYDGRRPPATATYRRYCSAATTASSLNSGGLGRSPGGWDQRGGAPTTSSGGAMLLPAALAGSTCPRPPATLKPGCQLPGGRVASGSAGSGVPRREARCARRAACALRAAFTTSGSSSLWSWLGSLARRHCAPGSTRSATRASSPGGSPCSRSRSASAALRRSSSSMARRNTVMSQGEASATGGRACSGASAGTSA